MERKQKTEKGHDGVRWLRTFGLFVLPAAAILSLVGCSKDWADSPGDASGTVALDFSVEGIGEMLPATKAALASNTTVRVIAYSSNATNPATANYVADQAYYWNGTKLVPCTVDANGNKTADAAEQEMKLPSDNTYDFYAVSPALPLATDKRTLSTAVNNGMDYAITTSKTTKQIDYQTTPYALTLNTLQRQFAQVKFNVTSEGFASISSLEVAGLADAVSGVTVGNTLTAASSGTQIVSIGESAFTISGSTAAATTTVLPLNNVDLSLTVTLTVGGLQSEVSGDIKRVNLESGKSYTITLTISNDPIQISFSVTEGWSTNSGNNATMGDHPGYPYVIDGNIIVTQDLWGGCDYYPKHSKWVTTPDHVEYQIVYNDSGGNTVGWKFKVGQYKSSYISWTYAKKICDNGWRLPTVRELRAIIELIITGRLDNSKVGLDDNDFAWAATGMKDYPGWGWCVGWYSYTDVSGREHVDVMIGWGEEHDERNSTDYVGHLCVQDL